LIYYALIRLEEGQLGMGAQRGDIIDIRPESDGIMDHESKTLGIIKLDISKEEADDIFANIMRSIPEDPPDAKDFTESVMNPKDGEMEDVVDKEAHQNALTAWTNKYKDWVKWNTYVDLTQLSKEEYDEMHDMSLKCGGRLHDKTDVLKRSK
jgi:hypothetical protein